MQFQDVFLRAQTNTVLIIDIFEVTGMLTWPPPCSPRPFCAASTSPCPAFPVRAGGDFVCPRFIFTTGPIPLVVHAHSHGPAERACPMEQSKGTEKKKSAMRRDKKRGAWDIGWSVYSNLRFSYIHKIVPPKWRRDGEFLRHSRQVLRGARGSRGVPICDLLGTSNI